MADTRHFLQSLAVQKEHKQSLASHSRANKSWSIIFLLSSIKLPYQICMIHPKIKLRRSAFFRTAQFSVKYMLFVHSEGINIVALIVKLREHHAFV